jgi:uncharacterized protein YecA (UPF0149 family)
MKIQPILHHQIAEVLFNNRTLTNEQLDQILSCDKNTLTADLQSIIQFCNNDVDDIRDDISYNLLYYALFLLKEIDAENQLNTILDILKWSDDTIEYWFGDLFTEYYWSLIYHFGKHQVETLEEFLKQDNIDTFSKEQVALALLQIYFKNPENQNSISTIWTNLLLFYNAMSEDSESIDPTYFAFFTSYIYEPNDDQKELIKKLYDKQYIDFSVNGDYDELFEIIETEKKCLNVFEVNNEFIKFENRPSRNYYSEMFEDFNGFKNVTSPIVVEKKVNRNDPCPCGSGKKYKKCCLN